MRPFTLPAALAALLVAGAAAAQEPVERTIVQLTPAEMAKERPPTIQLITMQAGEEPLITGLWVAVDLKTHTPPLVCGEATFPRSGKEGMFMIDAHYAVPQVMLNLTYAQAQALGCARKIVIPKF
jgi:hypothetical protein